MGLVRKSVLLGAAVKRPPVRIPLRVWMFVSCIFVCFEGNGLCDGLIIHAGDSYRMCVCVCVCDLEPSRVRRPRAELGYIEKGNTLPLYLWTVYVHFGSSVWTGPTVVS